MKSHQSHIPCLPKKRSLKEKTHKPKNSQPVYKKNLFCAFNPAEESSIWARMPRLKSLHSHHIKIIMRRKFFFFLLGRFSELCQSSTVCNSDRHACVSLLQWHLKKFPHHCIAVCQLDSLAFRPSLHYQDKFEPASYRCPISRAASQRWSGAEINDHSFILWTVPDGFSMTDPDMNRKLICTVQKTGKRDRECNLWLIFWTI